MNFIPALHPHNDADQPLWWFIFQNNLLLVRRGAIDRTLPYLVSPVDFESLLVDKQYLGAYGPTGCYAARLPADTPPPDGLELVGLRELFGVVEEDLFRIGGRANQLVHWAANHQFCGRCG